MILPSSNRLCSTFFSCIVSMYFFQINFRLPCFKVNSIIISHASQTLPTTQQKQQPFQALESDLLQVQAQDRGRNSESVTTALDGERERESGLGPVVPVAVAGVGGKKEVPTLQ